MQESKVSTYSIICIFQTRNVLCFVPDLRNLTFLFEADFEDVGVQSSYPKHELSLTSALVPGDSVSLILASTPGFKKVISTREGQTD